MWENLDLIFLLTLRFYILADGTQHLVQLLQGQPALEQPEFKNEITCRV